MAFNILRSLVKPDISLFRNKLALTGLNDKFFISLGCHSKGIFFKAFENERNSRRGATCHLCRKATAE